VQHSRLLRVHWLGVAVLPACTLLVPVDGLVCHSLGSLLFALLLVRSLLLLGDLASRLWRTDRRPDVCILIEIQDLAVCLTSLAVGGWRFLLGQLGQLSLLSMKMETYCGLLDDGL
ncbi:hypothetical protein BC831DRAFT_446546, partial [Entophlyctis helioformis]